MSQILMERETAERHDELSDRFVEQRLSLKSIRDVISPDCYHNPTYKGLFYFFRDLFIYAAVVVGLWNLNEWYYVVPLWALAGLSISSLFVIGHDAAHAALFKSKRLNYWVGQIAMLPSLHAFHQWVVGHNYLHHGHTIKVEKDFVWNPDSPRRYKRRNVFGKVLHRIGWSPLGAGVYYMIQIWLRTMILIRVARREAKIDHALVVATGLLVAGGLFYLGGASEAGFNWQAGLWLWTKVFFVPFILWNYSIGFIVYVHHIHHEIPWKNSKNWSGAYGQLFGTINYHVPAVINFFFHDIMIHMPHHVHVKIPFYHLRQALEDIKVVYGEFVKERDSMFRDYLQSTRKCKLFDSRSGEWVPYGYEEKAVSSMN